MLMDAILPVVMLLLILLSISLFSYTVGRFVHGWHALVDTLLVFCLLLPYYWLVLDWLCCY